MPRAIRERHRSIARNSSVKARMISAPVACMKPSGIGRPNRSRIIAAIPAPEMPEWLCKSSTVAENPSA